MPFVKEKKRGEFLEKRFVDFRVAGSKVKKLDIRVMMPSVFYCWSVGALEWWSGVRPPALQYTPSLQYLSKEST
jgi:hypothetical protein